MASTTAYHKRGGPKYALTDHSTNLECGSFPNEYNGDSIDDYLSHRLVLEKKSYRFNVTKVNNKTNSFIYYYYYC